MRNMASARVKASPMRCERVPSAALRESLVTTAPPSGGASVRFARRVGLTERPELVGVRGRKEAAEPLRVGLLLQNHPHESRLFQTGRDEIGASRFVGDRAIAVVPEEARGGGAQGFLQFGAFGHLLGVQARRDAEGGIGVTPVRTGLSSSSR